MNVSNTTGRSGFTLIELLVVIAILGILLTILFPLLGGAIETANRTVCMSKLEQLGIAHLAFAADNDGSLPPHQVQIDGLGQGVYAVYSRGWQNHAIYNRYRGNGILYEQGYISGEFLYCPSWTLADIEYGVDSTSTTGGPIWQLADFPSHQRFMQTSYAFRGYTYGERRPANIFRDPPVRTAIAADHFSDPGRGVKWHHGDGYNVLTLDGSVRWVHDPDHRIQNYNGGASYFVRASGYRQQDQVWSTLLAR